MSLRNVYVAGTPIYFSSRLFKGRQHIFHFFEQESIKETNKGSLFLLFGTRRSGKTSILRKLPEELRSVLIVININLEIFSVIGNETEMLQEIIRYASRDLSEEYNIELPSVNNEELITDPYKYFENWIGDIENNLGSRKLLITFDEYEVLEDRIRKGSSFENIIRTFYRLINQHSKLWILFCGVHLLEELSPAWIQHFPDIKTIYVGALEEPEARELIISPVPDFSLPCNDIVVKRIIQYTGGQPWLIQYICCQIVYILNDSGRDVVNLDDVDVAISNMQNLRYVSDMFLGERTEQQKKIVLELIKAGSVMFEKLQSTTKIPEYLLKKDIEILQNIGIIKLDKTSYSLEGEFVINYAK